MLNQNLMVRTDGCERKSRCFDISLRFTISENGQKSSITHVVLGSELQQVFLGNCSGIN